MSWRTILRTIQRWVQLPFKHFRASVKTDIKEVHLPKQVLTLPLGPSSVPVSGFALKFFTPTHEIWQLLVRWDSSLETIAKLLAILMLDEVERIMPAEMMPPRPGTVVLRTDGEIRQGRGFFLARWALREIDRLTQLLSKDHSAYLASVSRALNQQPDRTFGAVPPDFIWRTTLFPRGSVSLHLTSMSI